MSPTQDEAKRWLVGTRLLAIRDTEGRSYQGVTNSRRVATGQQMRVSGGVPGDVQRVHATVTPRLLAGDEVPTVLVEFEDGPWWPFWMYLDSVEPMPRAPDVARKGPARSADAQGSGPCR